jgi:CelD/BcsL family acetyltransferase involved in cellulose biosynthesis
MKFTLHKDISELHASTWNQLLSQSVSNVPFLRYEYLSAWWGTRGGGEWPEAELVLVSATENGELMGIAPLFLTEYEGARSLLFLGSIEISDYLDLIVRTEVLPRFLSGLLDYLTSDSVPAWSRLEWVNLPDASATLPALKAESARRGWTYTEEIYRPTPYIPLPGDFEAYLGGIDKKQRHEIRRKIRRAEESDQQVHWYIVTDEAALDPEIDNFLGLMANDHHKEEFLTEVMRTQLRASVHAAFKAGYLQLAFMEVDGQKAAGYLNFDYDGRILVYNSGLDFNFKELSPGWVLLAYLIQWANEHGRSEFDFMRGEEEYKYRFGGINRYVKWVKIQR